jgi:hypothetical protein
MLNSPNTPSQLCPGIVARAVSRAIGQDGSTPQTLIKNKARTVQAAHRAGGLIGRFGHGQ